MHEIKNLLFQPLTLHRHDGTGLHLGPRERYTIANHAVSAEIRQAERRGHISLRPVETTPAAPATTPSTKKEANRA